MKSIIRILTVTLFALQAALQAADVPPAKPNILWIVMDDVGAELPCYGEKTIRTPNIDRLVGEGTRFDRAFLTSSVCSPSRSAIRSSASAETTPSNASAKTPGMQSRWVFPSLALPGRNRARVRPAPMLDT